MLMANPYTARGIPPGRRGQAKLLGPARPIPIPYVVRHTPALGARVAISTTVTATFSDVMTSGTITTSSFLVAHGPTPIAGTVTYSAGTKTATFTPTSTLPAGSTFQVTLTVAITSARSVALSAPVVWYFITPGPPPGRTNHRWFAGLRRRGS